MPVNENFNPSDVSGLPDSENSLKPEGRGDILFAIEAMGQLIACHEEETCPAIEVAKEAMMRLSLLL